MPNVIIEAANNSNLPYVRRKICLPIQMENGKLEYRNIDTQRSSR